MIHLYKKILGVVFMVFLMLPQTLLALSSDQRRVLDSGAYYYNIEQTPVSCGNITSLNGTEGAEQIWNYLIAKGLTPPQAAGILGNIQSESAGTFDPRIVEFAFSDPPHRSDTVPPNQNSKGQPGYGIVQWTAPGRKDGLRDLSAERGVIAGDMLLQLDYLWIELTGDYKTSTLDPIMATDDYIESTDIFLEKFERPADIPGTRPGRRAQALHWLNEFGSGTSGSLPTSTSSCGSSGPVPLDASGCPTDAVDESEIVDVRGIKVHPCIEDEVERLLSLAESQGLDLHGGGYRSSQGQIETRKNNCGPTEYDIYEKPAGDCRPPTAIPGTSRHERGTAVDFTCDGSIFSSRSNKCYIFLDENTSLKNLPSEAWHWSIDGN